MPDRMSGVAMAEATSAIVSINGCDVAYRRAGSGPTLLYLHGAGGAYDWAPFMARLAANHDLIVPEHPGFGRSDTPSWLDSIEDLAYYLLEFAEALDLRDIHVVGSSLGGWIAMEAAVRGFPRMRSLTLSCSAGVRAKGVPTGDPFLWNRAQQFRAVLHDQAMADAAIAREPTPEQVEVELKDRYAFARVAWEPRLHNPHLKKWLHRVRVPTQVLWGANDRLLPLGHGEEIARLIPGAALRTIPDCGHLPQIEKAEAWIAAVAGFIAEH
jgi:pimeloyl-ACP methyl ester carboxylesterase